MAEKHLLQEITYYSQLIGQHKHHQMPNNINLTKTSNKNNYILDNNKHIAHSVDSKHVSSNNIYRYKKVYAGSNAKMPFIVPKEINLISNTSSSLTPCAVQSKSFNAVCKLSESSCSQGVKNNPGINCKTEGSGSGERGGGNDYVHRIHVNPRVHIKPSIHVNPRVHVTPRVHINPRVQVNPRVHVNPHFLNANCSLQTEKNMENKSSISKPVKTAISKPSMRVHINPKVFSVMRTKNEDPSTSNHIANENDLTEASSLYLKKVEEDSVSKTLPRATKSVIVSPIDTKRKYSFCNKTLVKENMTTLPHSESKTKAIVLHTKPISHILSPQSSPFMSISRTKLVRVPIRTRRSSAKKNMLKVEPKSVTLSTGTLSSVSSSASRDSKRTVTPFSRVRRVSFTMSPSVSLKLAKSVCSKYKIRNIPFHTTKNGKVKSSPVSRSAACSRSKYKIDRRLHKTPKRLKNVKKYSLKYENPKREVISTSRRSSVTRNTVQTTSWPSVKRSSFTNKVWSSVGFSQPRRVVISNRKLLRIGCSPNERNIRNRKGEQVSGLVRIGGVLYKTSRTKLTLSKDVERNACHQRTGAVVKKCRPNARHIVYVRGNKFVMDPLGKTLKRIPSEKPLEKRIKRTPIKRIDIGGVTFIQKSANVLVRTNTHNARNLLSQAKQKSIALLTRKMRKNNQPCLFYNRFGKCFRNEKGTCQLIHDPKNISICKRFLQGHCEVSDCKLSHDVVPEKMPTCRFFLEGCCVRDSCPYPHIKISSKAVICRSFLQGYCVDGRRCKKRHMYLCPEFEKHGSCRKGKCCPYPHRADVKKNVSNDIVSSCRRHVEAPDTLIVQRKRYYQSDACGIEQIKPDLSSHTDTVVLSQTENSSEHTKHQRKNHHLNSSQCDDSVPLPSTSNVLPQNSSHTSEESDDEPEVKRPRIGRLPSYIALDSSIEDL